MSTREYHHPSTSETSPPAHPRIIRVGVAALAVALGCEPGAVDEDFETMQEKYPSLPDDGPIDLSVPPDAILDGAAEVELAVGESKRFVITKEAGKRYTIGLTALTADLDLFGHWVPEVSRNNHQFASWAYGVADEQFGFTATEDGDYHIMVHGYEAGHARLEIYVSEPPASNDDEVIWPVEWAHDGSSEDELLGGGLAYLEPYGYSCGEVFHPGLDMNHGGSPTADLGLPVFAIADGRVSGAGSSGGWGKVVTIEHWLSDHSHVESLYGHLDQYYVGEGEEVRKGQQIGTIGAPPTSTPHLHFEIREPDLSTFFFPCAWGKHSVEASYEDPAAFIRAH